MNCPICKMAKSEEIYRLCDNMKVLGETFPEGKATLAACKNCGLVYIDTFATQDNFLSYYQFSAVAPKYYEMFGQEPTERYYNHILSRIQPYITSESELLDVAGAWGELGKFLLDKGFSHVTVVDPNKSCIEAANDKGLSTCLCSSLDMAERLIEKYDLILLNHTLEHIVDVSKTMENVKALLKDDGFLFIEVPNAAGYINEDSAPFNFLTYEHVLHLTSSDINNIAGLYGFEVIEMNEYYKEVSRYPSIYAVLKKNEQNKNVNYSDLSKLKMIQYIEKSKQRMEEFISPLRISGEPLILWGIGASTASLLELFSECNVKTLIDSNPKRQGLTFNIGSQKYNVESPEQVKDGTIVVLSIPYFNSIEKQIRNMGIKNKIVSLSR